MAALAKARAVLDANPEIRREVGRKAVESGQAAKARAKALAVLAANPEIRRKTGSWAVESGQAAKSLMEAHVFLSANPEIQRESGRRAVESGQTAKARAKALIFLAANPEIRRENGRKTGRWAVESGHLARISEMYNNPSDEEVSRLHTRFPGWIFNAHIDPKDGGNKIEVDAFRGIVCAFYDGAGKYKRGSKKNPNREAEQRAFEEKQRRRLTDAGYIVRFVFNRAPNEVEVLQWNLLADVGR